MAVRPFFFALLLLAAPALAPSHAQPPPPTSAPPVPMCVPQREGMVACFEGRLCLCRFQPGGQLTGRPDGHRWDCGALRPDCRPPPAMLDPGPFARPPWSSPGSPGWPSGLPPPQIFLSPGQMPPAGAAPGPR